MGSPVEGHGSSTLILLTYLYTYFFFFISHTGFFRDAFRCFSYRLFIYCINPQC